MSPNVREVVHRWLDEAGSSMGGDAARRSDALLELETTIYERLEERTRQGELPDEAIRDVLDAMGEPAAIGGGFLPMRPLVAPEQTRSFFAYALMLFAVHFLLVIGATVVGRGFSVPPIRIAPIEGPKAVLPILARAVETFVFDCGAVLCGFLVFRRLGWMIRFPRAALAVSPDRRRCLESASFLALVLVVVDFFRDNLLAIYLHGPGETSHVPLVGPGIVDNLLLFNVWLGLAIARDLLYAFRGERRATLGVDLLGCCVGLYCLLRMVATEHLVDLGPASGVLGTAADGVGALLNTSFTLIALAAAALLAARVVRRGFRLALLRG
jgi:hypothetical protein